MDDDRTPTPDDGLDATAPGDDDFSFLTAPLAPANEGDAQPTAADAGEPAAETDDDATFEAPLLAVAREPESASEPDPVVRAFSLVPRVELPEGTVEAPAAPTPSAEPAADRVEIAALATPAPPDLWEAPAEVAPAAADHEPTPAPEPAKVPWHKREIGRGKKAAPAAGAKTARRQGKKEKKEKKIEAPPAAAAEQPKPKRAEKDPAKAVPFYRRELSLKRKPKDGAQPVAEEPPAPAVEAPPAAPAAQERRPAKAPRRARKPRAADGSPVAAAPDATASEPQAPRQPPARTPLTRHSPSIRRRAEPQAAADAAAPAEKKPSRLRKERPQGRREVQLGSRRPSAPAAATPAAPEGDAPAAAERKPFYRRELSLPKREKPAAKPVEQKAEKKAEKKAAKAEKPRKDEKRRRPKRDRKAAKPAKAARPAKTLPSKGKRKGGDHKRYKKLVGLKIGASQLAAAQVVNNGHAELVRVARDPLADGVVAGGELRDPDALTAALKSFFKTHRLPRRNVRLGIANNRIGVRTFDIAGVDDPKQLANAIKFRAQEALPIPIEEAVLDWRVLSERIDDEGQLTRRVLLVVAYRELIDRYVAACKKAGIQLVGIDLEAFALLRALGDGAVRSTDDGALVAVSVGHERSTFAVSDGAVCEFTRVLEWGGNSLNVAIARAVDKAPSEVEALKHALSLEPGYTVAEGVDADEAGKATDAVRQQLQTFARELVSSLQFYQSQPGSLGIGEIILTGGTAEMPGLDAELERLIGVRVRVGDPLMRVRVSKRVADADGLGSLSVAIGLGIED